MVSRFFLSTFLFIVSLGMLFSSCVDANDRQISEKIPNSIISIASGYIVVVDKQNQKLHVFKKDGSFSRVFSANCSTGKNQGGKQISGDAKTPHGIFFATKVIFNPGPPETYGTVAFPLDYPNPADKKAGRNGTNIWIHGTLKPLLPFNSNGCVVLTDQDAHQLVQYIQVNKTPIIIDDTITWIAQDDSSKVQEELADILTSWMKGYVEGDIKAIDALYLKGTQITGKKRQELLSQLKTMKNINQHFVLSPRDISFLHQPPNAVIVFDHVTGKNRNNTLEVSFNRLTLEKINDKWFVIDDMETPVVLTKSKKTSPSDRKAETEKETSKVLRQFVLNWADNWETGDMNAYRLCYSPGFRSREKNLNAWIKHKIDVRNRSKNIKIRIDNLRISSGRKYSTAQFTQHYSSNLLKSKGVKQLKLVKIKGHWKIYRETIR